MCQMGWGGGVLAKILGSYICVGFQIFVHSYLCHVSSGWVHVATSSSLFRVARNVGLNSSLKKVFAYI